ncbi:MAG: hypothetical protein ICV73_30850 [Acetobacteraceae bacterium]|nr:hypothetical protein [Acetobacteraceae bacterium]
MRRRTATVAALFGLAAPAAGLAEKACFISYGGFEEKVAHLDIEVCPGAQVKAEEGFCRIGLDGAAVLVYTFRNTDAEPCLARVDRYEFNEFARRFGVAYDKP